MVTRHAVEAIGLMFIMFSIKAWCVSMLTFANKHILEIDGDFSSCLLVDMQYQTFNKLKF